MPGTNPSGSTIGGFGPDGLPTSAPTNVLPDNSIVPSSQPGQPNAQESIKYSTKFKPTQGWYITGGIVVSVMLANTKAGAFLLGILGVALIYQVNLLIQHK